MTMNPWRGAAAAVLAAALLAPLPIAAQDGDGDPHVLALMQAANEQLRAAGMGIAVEQIELFTIGGGRPLNRLHQRQFRWVAGDTRRLAQGDDITYLIDESDGATTSGLTPADTSAAIERALDTWRAEGCLKKVDLVRRADTGADPDVFDFVLGFGGLGDPFLADFVHAGWMPRGFFEALLPGGGGGILAASLTFVFTDGNGQPTDVNGDNYNDTSSNEVYYNDTFGDPNDNRAQSPWGIDVDLFSIDVETIALHETGHSLGIGHFGPPPTALMNPIYAGRRQAPEAVDRAGMCAVWAGWPQ